MRIFSNHTGCLIQDEKKILLSVVFCLWYFLPDSDIKFTICKNATCSEHPHSQTSLRQTNSCQKKRQRKYLFDFIVFRYLDFCNMLSLYLPCRFDKLYQHMKTSVYRILTFEIKPSGNAIDEF
jgi:hypothetical protein